MSFDIYVKISILINYNYNNHHTLHDTSPDLAGTLTRLPWPIFRAPMTLTQFTLTFQIFSTIRPTTTKPCIVHLLDVLTWQVPWPSDLDLYVALQWLWHILRQRSISSQLQCIKLTTIKPCNVLLLNVLTQQIPWPGDLDLYLGCSDFNLCQRSRSPQV